MPIKERFKGIKGVIVIIATIFTVLITLELGLRIAAHFIIGLPLFDVRISITDEELGWKKRPGYVGPGFGLRRVVLNKHGFRGKDYAFTPKGDNTLRLMILGDSNTAGIVSLDDEHLYTTLLEEKLNRRFGDSLKVEVANAANSGYSTHQGKIILQRYFDVYSPDIVVVYLGANDCWPAGNPDSEGYACTHQAMSKLDNSMIYKVLKYIIRKAIANRVRQKEKERLLSMDFEIRDVVRVPPEQNRENIFYMAEYVDSRGAKMILFTYPHIKDYKPIERYMNAYRENIFECQKKYGCYIFDLEKLIASFPKDSVFSNPEVDAVHLNRAGQALLAEKFAEYLEAYIEDTNLRETQLLQIGALP